MRRFSLVILSLGFLGCVDPDFNQPELLKAPRILAVQAEPPQPSFGGTTTLRALVYQPPLETDAAACAATEPAYRWSWCPLPTSSSDGYRCPVDDATLAVFFAMLAQSYPEMGQVPPSVNLGTGETATLRNPFPARLLHDLCTGDVEIPAQFLAALGLPVRPDAGLERIFSCDKPNFSDPNNQDPLGFPITVKLQYTPPCWSPPQDKYGPDQTAVFTVHLPTDDTLPPNQNPIAGEIYAIAGVDGGMATVPIPDAGAPAEADVGGAAIDGGETIDGGEASDGADLPDGGTPITDAALTTPEVALLGAPDGGVLVGTTPFPRNKRVALWLDLPNESAEKLVRPGLLDEPKQGQVYHFERLALTWFAEAGQFGGSHGSYGRHGGFTPTPNELELTPADYAVLETGRQTHWALPLVEDYKKNHARVVVVVRDSRGGVTWAEAVADVETPQ